MAKPEAELGPLSGISGRTVFLGALLAVLLVGGVSGVVTSANLAEAPDPTLSVSAPDSIELGQSFTIAVEGTNYGGTGGEYSSISVSFPDHESDGLIAGKTHDLDYGNIYEAGEEITHKDGTPMDATDLLVESGIDPGNTWGSGTTHELDVTVDPDEPGTMEFYSRVTLTDPSSDALYTAPASSSYEDQQGYRVERHTVEIKPDLDMSLSAEDGPHNPGDTVEFDVTVTNNEAVSVDTWIDVSGQTPSGNWDLGRGTYINLDSGEQRTVSLDWTVPDDAEPGSYRGGTAAYKTSGKDVKFAGANTPGTFEVREEHTLTVEDGSNGNFRLEPPGTTYSGAASRTYLGDESVTIEAQPGDGYVFDHWSGDVPSGDADQRTLTVTMDADRTLQPHFSQGEGSITVDVRHANGDQADNANALLVYQDHNWDGPVREIKNQPGVDLTKTIANLPAGHEYLVSAYVNDQSGGSTGWIDVGSGESVSKTIEVADPVWIKPRVFYSDGSTPLEGATVVLKSHEGVEWRSNRTVADGYTEVGKLWTHPAKSGGAGYYTVEVRYDGSTVATKRLDTLESSREVTLVTSEPVEKHDLAVSLNASRGDVRLNPPDEVYDGKIDRQYKTGTSVTVTATPETGYVFDRWSGDVPAGSETDPTVSVDVTSATSLEAQFTRAQGELEITVRHKDIIPNFIPGESDEIASEVNALHVYDDSGSLVEKISTRTWSDESDGDLVDMPKSLSLPAGDSYKVVAYVNDQKAGNTSWIKVDPGKTEETISIEDYVPYSPTIYYLGGLRPMENATIRVWSHEYKNDNSVEPVVWRSASTDANGIPEVSSGNREIWLFPTEVSDPGYYYAEVYKDGEVIGSEVINEITGKKSSKIITEYPDPRFYWDKRPPSTVADGGEFTVRLAGEAQTGSRLCINALSDCREVSGKFNESFTIEESDISGPPNREYNLDATLISDDGGLNPLPGIGKERVSAPTEKIFKLRSVAKPQSFPFKDVQEAQGTDAFNVSVERERVSEDELNITLSIKKGPALKQLHGKFSPSSQVILMTNDDRVRLTNPIESNVDGKTTGLYAYEKVDTMLTAFSFGKITSVKKLVKELIKESITSTAEDWVTSKLRFETPLTHKNADDLSYYRNDFSTDDPLSPGGRIETFSDYTLSFNVELREGVDHGNITIIPSLRGKTGLDSITGSVGGYVPHSEYRRQIIVPVTNATQAEENVAPNARISDIESEINEGQSIDLDASISSDPDGSDSDLKYSWEVTDKPSDVEAPLPTDAKTSVSFSRPGTYVYTVTVSDGDKQDTATVTTSVRGVNDPPEATLSASASRIDEGAEMTLDAMGSSDPDGDDSQLIYSWKVLSQPTGANAPTPSGAGGSVTLSTPGVYEYEVTVSDGEKQDTATVTVTVGDVNAPPEATLSPSSATIDEGGTMTLSAAGSSDPDGDDTQFTYSWTVLSEPSGATAPTPNGASGPVTLSTPGEYVYEVTVSDGDKQDTARTTVTVSDTNAAPSAAVTATPATLAAGETVELDAGDSKDTDGTIATYEWDFDSDGTYERSTTTPTVSHTFESAGSRMVRLRVTDDDGKTDTATTEVTVTSQTNELPTARITSNRTTVSGGGTVSFDGAESTDPDGTIATYEWDFDGDGITDATGESVAHTFKSSGDYSVALTVTDNDNVTDTATRTVTVTETEDQVGARLDTNDGHVEVRAREEQEITGNTNAKSGTGLSLRVNSQSDVSPFLMTLETTVQSGGGSDALPNSFAFTGDFSDRAAGIDFEATVRQDGEAISDTYEGRILSAARGSVSVSSQDVGDSEQRVVVDSATLSDGGFVALFQDSADGPLLGHSRYLEAGQHSDVQVPLDTTVAGDTTVVAVPYLDENGDEVLNSSGADRPYTDRYGPVLDSATVTAPVDEDPGELSAQNGVAIDGDTAYLTESGRIHVVNLTTDEVTNEFEAPDGNAAGLAYGSGSLWFADGIGPEYDGEIVELDPETGAVRSRIDTSYDPVGLSYGDGSLWAIDVTFNNVVEYAPNGTELGQFDTRDPTGSTSARGLAYANGSVWVGTDDGGLHEFSAAGTYVQQVDDRAAHYNALGANETTLFGPGPNGAFTDLRTVATDEPVQAGPVGTRSFDTSGVAPGEKKSVNVNITARGNRVTLAEAFSPEAADAAIVSVTVDGEVVRPTVYEANAEGVIVALDGLTPGDHVSVEYEISIPDSAEDGDDYAVSGSITGETNVSLGTDTVTVAVPVIDASPLDGIAGEYDRNEDGKISISELGTAASAYATGDLSIAELGTVAQVYAAS